MAVKYPQVINSLTSVSAQDKFQLMQLFDAVYDDLADVRAKHTALLTKMDADFANVTNASVDYASTTAALATDKLDD